jgi:hypothetical protein
MLQTFFTTSTGKMTMLVDLVLYGGEADLFKARLGYVDADVTIVVEGDHTFTNKPKGFLFENVDDLGWHEDRIIFHGVKSPGFSDPWANEAHQRNAARQVLESLDLGGDAIVGMFDADEFPDPEYIRAHSEPLGWNMAKYQMSLYWFQRKELNGVSAPWWWLSGKDLDEFRRGRDSYRMADAGLHFSSFGSKDEVLRKWTGFSHTEFLRPDMPEWVSHCWDNGVTIEGGITLEESEQLDLGLPDYMLELKGPAHWYRRRL